MNLNSTSDLFSTDTSKKNDSLSENDAFIGNNNDTTVISKASTSCSSIQSSNQHFNSLCSQNVNRKSSKFLNNLSKHKAVAILCILVAFGGYVFGWDTGTISGFVQMPSFKESFGEFNAVSKSYEFSNTRVGLIISIFNIGCAIGGITLAKLGDLFGRKLGLIIVMIIYIIGIIIQISSFHWYQYMIGRIVSGLAVGAVSVLSPMFIAETSPSEIRGIMVSCYQLMITLGILMGYCTTFGTVHNYTESKQWRIPLGLCFAWALLMILGMAFLPESSRYLIKKGKFEEAKISIAKVNSLEVDNEKVLNELNTINDGIQEEEMAGNANFKELITGKPYIFIRLIIGITLQSFQQLTGNNYFFYYGTSIFKSVGLDDSFITSIILGAVNFGSTFVALYSIDKLSRRQTLIGGSFFMSICLLIFSIIGSTSLYPNGYDNPTDKNMGYGMIILTCIFIFFFATTWAPGVFVVVSETYPLRIRSKAMAIATAANWIWGFLIAFFTPLITNHIRFNYGFVFFSCTVLAGIFVFLMVPETGGLTLEKVDELYYNYNPGKAALTLKKTQEQQKTEIPAHYV